jgi:hypothetical protein
MNDRELLELAAKAAGIEILAWTYSDYAVVSDKGDTWTPLTDDGDALRLAVKLNMRVVITGEVGITDVASGEGKWVYGGEHHYPDPCAATRRAIVRAAAEIGRAMP